MAPSWVRGRKSLDGYLPLPLLDGLAWKRQNSFGDEPVSSQRMTSSFLYNIGSCSNLYIEDTPNSYWIFCFGWAVTEFLGGIADVWWVRVACCLVFFLLGSSLYTPCVLSVSFGLPSFCFNIYSLYLFTHIKTVKTCSLQFCCLNFK